MLESAPISSPCVLPNKQTKMEEGESGLTPQVGHRFLGQQEDSAGERAATSKAKSISKQPKKKRKFSNSLSRSTPKSLMTPQPQHIAVPHPTTNLKLSYEQLQRKVRDLAILNCKYKEEISKQKLVVTNLKVDAINNQSRLEGANIEEREGTANRIKAMENLHAEEIRRLSKELRNLSKGLTGEKKISNKVNATIIMSDFFTVT